MIQQQGGTRQQEKGLAALATTAPDQRTSAEAAQRLAALEALLPSFAERAAGFDATGSFVLENVKALRDARFYSAAVPAHHGGGGLPYAALVDSIRALARACPATALTVSMHQHVLMANVYNDSKGRGGEKLLRRVAEGEAVLVSTGAGDWLSSNGTLTPVEGGYRYTGRKTFASGSQAADILATSGRLGEEVLHFGVPFDAAGIDIGNDWDTLGMRGTGSQTVTLTDVFVPEGAVTLRRPAGAWHPVWAVVATVALPLVMAAYVGLADAAVGLAVDGASASLRPREGGPATDDVRIAVVAHEVGELRMAHTEAQNALAALVANAADLDFEPTVERAERAFVNKSLVARAVRTTLDQAFALSTGRAFFRRNQLERLLRDSYAAGFHLLQEREQLQFSGRVALGLDPVR